MKFKLLLSVFLLSLFVYACNRNEVSSNDPDPDPGNGKGEEVDPNDNIPPLKTLKIMTYNIHSCNPPSKPGEADVDAIAKVIKEANADIVFLQEVDKNTGRNGNYDDQAVKVAGIAGMEAQFFSARSQGKGFYGNAILSKYKMEEVKAYQLPREGSLEQRVLGTAVIRLPGKERIVAAVTHLQHNSATNRIEQIKEVISLLKDEKRPIVLGADFNEKTSATDFFLLFDNAFTRTCTDDATCPYTFPATNPSSMIDFLAYKPSTAFQAGSHYTIKETYASDHLPVVSILTFKR